MLQEIVPCVVRHLSHVWLVESCRVMGRTVCRDESGAGGYPD